MNKLITFSILLATSVSAFSGPAFNGTANIPEPGMLPLLGLGLLALTFAKRKKK